MSATVFANGNSIACKVADGQSSAAMPDVCLSPPSPPAGPIPIPYPNTGMASDTDDGSQTVQIGGQPVMLKDKSTFKKSTGNEAATKSLGMGVVTHQIQGKLNFIAWSMDVKFEGENVPRHLDLMGHNEASKPPNTPPWPYMDSMAASKDPCRKDKAREKRACPKKMQDKAVRCAKTKAAEKCRKAQKCMLQPHSAEQCCTPEEEGHHLVEVHCFTATGGRGGNIRLKGVRDYSPGKAPCVCAVGGREDGEHGVLHAVQQTIEGFFHFGTESIAKFPNAGKLKPGGSGARETAEAHWTYGEARDAGVTAHKTAYPHCDSGCIKAQLDNYHKDDPDGPGCDEDTPLRTDPDALGRSQGQLTAAQEQQMNNSWNEMHGFALTGTS